MNSVRQQLFFIFFKSFLSSTKFSCLYPLNWPKKTKRTMSVIKQTPAATDHQIKAQT